jgi:UDP-2-acetamido-3-amino-2,3-dideoxy-glucuronate N-acetyltransferase
MESENKFMALVGLGYWGRNVLRNLNDLGVLKIAHDADEEVVRERKASYPDLHFAASYDEILERSDIGAVAVASSAASHHALVKQALLAGKDVFVEKPLALRAEEGQELVDLAGKKGRILMVGHVLQYHPAVVKLKELISKGELGKIHYIYSNRLNIGKLRTEENILWSFAPHDISIILTLLGEEPVFVSAFGGDYLSRGIYDTTLTTLEFKNGVKGHIFVSWIHPFKEQKLIVVGSSAMAVFNDLGKEKLLLYSHRIEWKNGKIPVAQKAEGQAVAVGEGEPLRIELQHFLECVAKRTRPRTDGQEGLRVLRVLEAAEKAMVRLP